MSANQLALGARVACEICGPLVPPHVHRLCHDEERSPGFSPRRGCGHTLDDHTNSLRCRICGRECGIDCSVGYRH